MPDLRFSIGLPPNLSFDEYGRLAALAERYEFSLLVIDDIPNYQSCWGILFFLAMHTTRLHLGPSVTHPYQRHPLLTAANVAALDELSGGRAFLGLGRGDVNDHQALHLPMRRPLRTLREAAQIARLALAGSAEAFDGEVFQIDANFDLAFTPVRADVPIYLGVTAPMGFRLAGEIADGVHVAGLFRPQAISLVQENISIGAARVGRSVEEIDLAASCWASIGDDVQGAMLLVKRLLILRLPLLPAMAEAAGVEKRDVEAIAAHVARQEFDAATRHISDQAASSFSFCGTPEQAIRNLENVVGAGVRHVIFKPPLGPDRAQAITLIGERILPHFRDTP